MRANCRHVVSAGRGIFTICDLPGCTSERTVPMPEKNLGTIRMTPDNLGIA